MAWCTSWSSDAQAFDSGDCMSLPSSLASRLRLPLIAAPTLRVSGPDLVMAACRSGVIGAFPTVNARGAEQLDAWLAQIKSRCAEAPGLLAPVCPNIIMRRQATLDEDLRVLIRTGWRWSSPA